MPAAPGTAPDIITRLMADKLVSIWGKQVVVENRPDLNNVDVANDLSQFLRQKELNARQQ